MSEPNWKPLESVLPLDDCGAWMWMGRVERDGRTIEQYKHIATRRYLNLDQDGQAWSIRFGSRDCDPWCEVDHEHVKDLPPDVEPLHLGVALEWALS